MILMSITDLFVIRKLCVTSLYLLYNYCKVLINGDATDGKFTLAIIVFLHFLATHSIFSQMGRTQGCGGAFALQKVKIPLTPHYAVVRKYEFRKSPTYRTLYKIL